MIGRETSLKRRELLRRASVGVVAATGLHAVTQPAAAATTLSFGSTDLDSHAGETGVVHESTANSDHTNANVLKQGYKADAPFKLGNLAGYWPLHEDSGSTANDLSGNNNDGTITGATLGQTGLLGTSAYSFDGTDDHISVPNLGLNGGSSFTVCAWINLANTSSSMCLMGRYDGSDDIWQLTMGSSNNTMRFDCGHVGGNRAVATTSNNEVSSGTWEHWVGVFDSSGPSVEIYKNASSVATGSGAVDDFATAGGPDIGRRSDNVNKLEGRMADVRVYDGKAFTASEVKTLYDVVNTKGELVTSAKVK